MNTFIRIFACVALTRSLRAVSLVLLAAGCATAPPLLPIPAAESAKPPLMVKILAFNDFHGNLKTPNLTIRVPDATQPTGTRLEPAGGVEQMSALINSQIGRAHV